MPCDIEPVNYTFLRDRVYADSGIVLGDEKHYLFDSRLSPIVRQLGLGTINDLCALLRATADVDVGRQVVEAMTTNETYFFRDPRQYDAIRNVLIPHLKQERSLARSMKFWSAAASTGQEAYSLAMLLVDAGLGNWKTQILGTDYSSQAIERARAGLYQQIEVNRGLPASLLVKHFRRSGVSWQISDALRGMAEFAPIDLRRSMRTLGPFDLVFCRNVLIYFDAQTKHDVLRELHGTLFRGGWLLLGGAETAHGVDEWFDQQLIGDTTIYIAR